MKRRKILLFSIISTFLFIMLPQIPAIDYSLTKKHTFNLATDATHKAVSIIKNGNEPTDKIGDTYDKITPFINQLEQIVSYLQQDSVVSSIIGSILKFILSIITLILNILITGINLFAGILNTVFSVTINLIFGIIKKVLNLGSILQNLLDMVASVLTGLFGIVLDIVVGFLTLLKDIIVSLINPSVTF